MTNKAKKLFTLISFILAALSSQHVLAQQKTLFCAESIEYNDLMGAERCQSFCKQYSPDNCLESELKNGWKVDTASPKQVPEWIGDRKCNCIGQQYVLSKTSDKSKSTGTAFNKEIELLKKENELLKKEVLMLKNELNALKKKP